MTIKLINQIQKIVIVRQLNQMSKNKNAFLPKHMIKIYKLIKNQKHEKHAVIYFDIYYFFL